MSLAVISLPSGTHPISLTMKRFSPPYRFSYPRFDPRETPAGKRILSYYGRQPEGVTVYVLTDNTVTTTKPSASLLKTTYRGGYLYDISDADAAILTAAGFSVTDVPASVQDTTGTPGTPRAEHPVTWDDLAAMTWDQASQYLWGSFH